MHAEHRHDDGDVQRVRLDIDAQSDMTWVVLSDPVDATQAVVIYASLVLVAMVALFMITGMLGMRLLVERSRADAAERLALEERSH